MTSAAAGETRNTSLGPLKQVAITDRPLEISIPAPGVEAHVFTVG